MSEMTETRRVLKKELKKELRKVKILKQVFGGAGAYIPMYQCTGSSGTLVHQYTRWEKLLLLDGVHLYSGKHFLNILSVHQVGLNHSEFQMECCPLQYHWNTLHLQ